MKRKLKWKKNHNVNLKEIMDVYKVKPDLTSLNLFPIPEGELDLDKIDFGTIEIKNIED